MKQKLWGMTEQGEEVFLYTFENEHGMKLSVSNLGAVLTNLWVPNSEGHLYDVVLGYDSVAHYEKNDDTFFGATVGRNANRMANAAFELGGNHYQLVANEGEKNLHSGPDGYQLRIWQVKEINEQSNTIIFSLRSPDGDQGFPGNLTMDVSYQLRESEIVIKYSGCSDKDTLFNPTNHSYFNLNGHQNGDILNHRLQLQADFFTPLTNQSIPTGEICSVEGTPMDFRREKNIGKDIHVDYLQLRMAKGYDHNFVLNDSSFAKLVGDQSGIVMRAATNLPGVQIYTGNFLKNVLGKEGIIYHPRAGVCLETQYFPNAVNEPHFVTPLLEKNQRKEYWTRYSFS